MLSSLQHRGPDDEGTASFELSSDTVVALGSRRLSVIDPTGGHQPIFSEDGRMAVVCNGEIYNFAELRSDLERRGHRFGSRSDSEVIVHLYEEQGLDFIHHLRGMFAIALWDDLRSRLVLARDRLGVKPLYWSQSPTGDVLFAFASEPAAILSIPGFRRIASPEAIDAYLAFLYVPDPMTGFEGVWSLPPAHMLTWSPSTGARVERYWEVPTPEPDPNASRHFAGILDEAVRLRLVADVPLGAFFSGGLDSSSIVASALTAGTKLDTFTVGFQEAAERQYDETAEARTTAEALGVPHHPLNGKIDIPATLEAVARHFGEPFGNPTAFLTYELSRVARPHITVALSGDGSDELLGGYPRFLGYQAQRRLQGLPAAPRRGVGRLLQLMPESTSGAHWRRRLTEFGSTLASPPDQAYVDWVTYFKPGERHQLLAPPIAGRIGEHPAEQRVFELFRRAPPDPTNRLAFVELQTFLPGNVLRYGDRMSMAHGLEVRVPFTDHELIEVGMRIAGSEKIRRRVTKLPLRRAMNQRLPQSTLKRSKQGFNPPLGVWMAGSLAPLVDEYLGADAAMFGGLIRPEAARVARSAFEAGRRDLSLHVWSLVMLEAWLRAFEVEVPT